MKIHSGIFAWRIPWAEEPDELQSIGSQRVRYDLNSLTHNIHAMSPASGDSFISFFPINIPFISFSLISVARTSKNMLNIVARMGTLVLLLILKEMLSVFHH